MGAAWRGGGVRRGEAVALSVKDEKAEKDEEDKLSEPDGGGETCVKHETEVKAEHPCEDVHDVKVSSVYVDASGGLRKTDVGPRAVVGHAAMVGQVDAAVGAPPMDVLELERMMRGAHNAHKDAEAMKRPAAAKRPAHAAAPSIATRARRRLIGKRPVATLDQTSIEAKLASSKNMAVFQSWADHAMRNAIQRAGYSDKMAESVASTWYRKMRDIWIRHHGGQ